MEGGGEAVRGHLPAWREVIEGDKTCLSSPKLEELSAGLISFEKRGGCFFSNPAYLVDNKLIHV